MAEIDSRIYFQQQTPDIVGSIQKGLSMRDMLDQRAMNKAQLEEQQAIKNAYQMGTESNPDGSVSFNEARTLSEIAKINPVKAHEYKQKFEEQNFNNLKMTREKMNMATKMIAEADEKNWGQTVKQIEDMGLTKPGTFSNVYDPGLKRQYLMRGLTAKEQLDQQWKAKEYDLREKELAIKARGQLQKTKELNASQSKQLGLYSLGAKAEQQFRNAVADPDKYDPTGVGQWIDNSEWAPNWIKNNKAIAAQAAQANWVEAFLRDASGAAIPPSERMAYAKDFFPQPGDTKDVVANKQALREQKMENARISAGGDKAAQRVAFENNQRESNQKQASQKKNISPLQQAAQRELERRKQEKMQNQNAGGPSGY